MISGWYADPEERLFDRTYRIFPAYSAPDNGQLFFDAFSTFEHITWATRAVWAPSIVKKGEWHYPFFSANDIQ